MSTPNFTPGGTPSEFPAAAVPVASQRPRTETETGVRTPRVCFPDLRQALSTAGGSTSDCRPRGHSLPEVVFAPTAQAVEAVETDEERAIQAAPTCPTDEAGVDLPAGTSTVDRSAGANRTRSELPDSTWNEDPNESEIHRESRKSAGTNTLPFFPTADRIDPEAAASIVDQILRRHPAAAHGVIGFTGCGNSADVEDTCVLVARDLAVRGTGRVLLVDADCERGPLSRLIQNPRTPGWKNLLVGAQTDLDSLLLRSRELPLDFLPVGSVTVESWLRAGQLAKNVFQKFETRYQFVCLSLGNVFAPSTASLSGYCHGMFLQVDLTNTSRRVAQLAARELQRAGAPLLGCLASEAAPAS